MIDDCVCDGDYLMESRRGLSRFLTFVVQDFRVDGNPSSIGNPDSGCSQTAGEGEELAGGIQV